MILENIELDSSEKQPSESQAQNITQSHQILDLSQLSP